MAFWRCIFICTQNNIFIQITKAEIHVKQLFKATLKYQLEDICHLSMRTATWKRRYYSSPGYKILIIGFNNGDYIEVSEDTYQNFNEMHHLLSKMWNAKFANEKSSR